MNILNKSTLRNSLSLLPINAFRKIVLLVIIQTSVATLDILAIFLLGIISKLGLDYIQNKNVEVPEALTEIFGIEDSSFEVQAGSIALFVVTLFCVRTIFSIYANKKILFFLANQASFASRQIVEKIFRSKPQSVISKNSQDFLYGITSGIDNLTLNYLGALTIFTTEIVFLLLLISVVIIVEPITGIISLLIFASAAIGINKVTSATARSISAENTNAVIFYNKRLLETLLVYRELFLRKRDIGMSYKVQAARSKSLTLRARLMMLPTLSKYLFELTLIVGGAVIAITQLFISDALTALSSVIVFLATASRILPSLIRAQGAFISIRGSEGSSEVTIKHLRELEEEESLLPQSIESTDEVSKFLPNLKVSNLCFRYNTESHFEIDNLTFEISVGQFVAIVGESGAGKTTLVDLILGMQTPESGTVEISNYAPLETIRRWPGKLAYVPQDIMIIDGDIRSNVVLDESLDISDEEVLIALEKSHLKYDVLNMSKGLNEIVGERGTRLSGGQRQRLGIARALCTRPEMIVFDEATSSLDPLTEKTVTEAIYDKAGNVTLIVVAHRLSTVKNADLVILLDKGKIVAKGTFEEVRRVSPKFDQQAKLVNL